MRSRRTIASTLALAALLSACSRLSDAAFAGQYVVGNCQSDHVNFNTRAFVHELPSRGHVDPARMQSQTAAACEG